MNIDQPGGTCLVEAIQYAVEHGFTVLFSSNDWEGNGHLEILVHKASTNGVKKTETDEIEDLEIQRDPAIVARTIGRMVAKLQKKEKSHAKK